MLIRYTSIILFSTLRKHSVNGKDLKVLTLVGLPWDDPELDSLAVLHLNNRLYFFANLAQLFQICRWRQTVEHFHRVLRVR